MHTKVDITHTNFPGEAEKYFILKIREEEYPMAIAFEEMTEAKKYVDSLDGADHFFLRVDGQLLGWAYIAMRDNHPWFAIILTGSAHGKGYGSLLLQRLKENRTILYGWVVESYLYEKMDGSIYQSPVTFYLKNDFKLDDVYNDAGVLKTRRISWKR